MNKKSGILWLSWLYIKLHADVLFFFFLKLELTWNSVCYYTSGFICFCIIYLFVCLLETQGFTMKPRLAWTHGDQPASAGVNGESPHAPLAVCTLNPGTMLNFFLALISWCSGCLVGTRTAPLDLLLPTFPVHPLLPFVHLLKQDVLRFSEYLILLPPPKCLD